MCIFSEELYAWLRGKGIDVVNGAVGENFTTRGMDLAKLSKGDRLRVREKYVVQITDVRVRRAFSWSTPGRRVTRLSGCRRRA